MRRLIKFLHTLGAIGMMGTMACLLVLLAFLPEPARLANYALMRAAMGAIAGWIFLPSLALTLVAGLLARAATSACQNAGWASGGGGPTYSVARGSPHPTRLRRATLPTFAKLRFARGEGKEAGASWRGAARQTQIAAALLPPPSDL